MYDYDLSSGVREMGGGLERYTFQMPATFFKKATPDPRVLKQRLAGVYLLSPRPDAREILDVAVRLDGPKAIVKLTIQRGHYALAKLIREHEELTFNREEGFATCTCHPGARYPLLLHSVPDYREEL